MYTLFLERMGKLYKVEKIKGKSARSRIQTNGRVSQPVIQTDGRFGAMMNVSLTNEVRDGYRCSGRNGSPLDSSSPQGPVTLTLDSRKFEYVEQSQPASRKGSAKPSRTVTPTPGSLDT